MSDHDDKDLAELFAEMRARDEARTPPFDDVIDAARRRHAAPAHAPRWRVLAAAAAVLVAVGGSWALIRAWRAAPVAPAVPVWEWRSPTASLMDVPGTHLLRGMPALEGAGGSDALELPNLNGGIR